MEFLVGDLCEGIRQNKIANKQKFLFVHSNENNIILKCLANYKFF